MPLLDGRPDAVDAFFRPGNTFTVVLTWPAGSLTGRTFTAALDAAALSLGVVGDVMTITVSEAQTAAAEGSGDFVLTETTGGGTQELLAGTWAPSDRPGTPTSMALTVSAAGPVPVTVTAQGIPTTIGDITIAGEILTGTFGSPATFGGIEREGRVFPAGEMMSPGAVVNFGDGFPRLHCPAGITTDVYAIFEVEEWWLESTIGVYFEWVNDHSATGVVRFDCDIRQVKIGTQGPLTSTVLASRTVDVPDVPANLSTTTIVSSVANGNPTDLGDPGPLASFYRLRISRLGGHANDTLAGPIGIVAASMTRGQ